MADYQHVISVHAAESRRKKRPWASDDELFLGDVFIIFIGIMIISRVIKLPFDEALL